MQVKIKSFQNYFAELEEFKSKTRIKSDKIEGENFKLFIYCGKILFISEATIVSDYKKKLFIK